MPASRRLLFILLSSCTSSIGGRTDGGSSPGRDGAPGGADAASDARPGASDARGRADGGHNGGGRPPGGHFFPDGAPWYADVAGAALDADSDRIIGALQTAGWGLGRFQIDFSIEVLEADGTPRRAFTTTGDFYSPDCDHVAMPVPADGNVEGEDGYACLGDGDCHLLVADRAAGQLFEMWRADIRGDTFAGGCLAVWDMTRVYPPDGRGDQCTSADAAGYPIAPLVFTADEVAAGEIDHAIRFALPNSSIRDHEFFHPATHATNAGGGGADAVPYGARLRLRADFDETRFANEHARVVVRALKRYGMFLADGGNVALMGRSDRRTVAKWSDLMDSHALVGIEPRDFELLELSRPAIPLTFDCARTPL